MYTVWDLHTKRGWMLEMNEILLIAQDKSMLYTELFLNDGFKIKQHFSHQFHVVIISKL